MKKGSETLWCHLGLLFLVFFNNGIRCEDNTGAARTEAGRVSDSAGYTYPTPQDSRAADSRNMMPRTENSVIENSGKSAIENSTIKNSDNSAIKDSENSTAKNSVIQTSTIWCPEQYRKLTSPYVGSINICRPQSCVEVHSENVSNWILSNDPSVSIFKQQNSTFGLCRKFTVQFSKCSKIALDEHQYEILDNGTLWDRLSNSYWALGDFFRDKTGAIVCGAEPLRNQSWTKAADEDGPPLSGRTDSQRNQSWTPIAQVSMPPLCTSIEVSTRDFLFDPVNQSLFVQNVNRSLDSRYFKLQDNFTRAQVCVKMNPDFLRCPFTFIPRDQTVLMPDRSLWTEERVIPLGSYGFTEDGSSVVLCVVVDVARISEWSIEGPYIYGAVSLLSALCLLLTFVIQIWTTPKMNFHTRALLCLVFSLFVTYVALAIKNFAKGGFNSQVANLILFAINYIFSLGSFFWLNLLAFEFWKVFSRFHGTMLMSNGKKRIFLLKCLYAWGCPTLLFGLVLFISFRPDIQRTLGLKLYSSATRIWPFTEVSSFPFFFAPVLIILIVNLIFFVMTVIHIQRAKSATEMIRTSNSKMNLFKVYVKLLVVMGLFWFADIISWATLSRTGDQAWYPLDIINALQGVFIFIIYICKRTMWIKIKSKLCCEKETVITPSTLRKDVRGSPMVTRTTLSS